MKIKRLTLRHFKGIEHFEGDFSDHTFVYGANGKGKTTLVDAYHWLLFDKDSSDKSNFNIKTLDKDGQEIPRLDHEVSGLFLTDTGELSLRKVFKEKWVTKRGTTTEEFSGHETEYYVNEVPQKRGDYQAFVSKLIQEDVFKLISNPLYFASMPWQKQREMLFAMAGEVSDEALAAGRPDFQELLSTVAAKQTTMEKYSKELQSKITKAKSELDNIPARISEVERGMPEEQEWAELEAKIEKLSAEAASLGRVVDEQRQSDAAKAQAIKELNISIMDAEAAINRANEEFLKKERQERLSVQEKKGKISEGLAALSREIIADKNEVKRVKALIEDITKERDAVRKEWYEKRELKPVIEVEDACPTCKRAWDEDNKQAMREKALVEFNTSLAKQLDSISKQGVRLSEKLKELEGQLNVIESALPGKEEEQLFLITDRDKLVVPEMPPFCPPADLVEEKAKLEAERDALYKAESSVSSDERQRKDAIVKEIGDLRIELDKRERRIVAAQRIDELRSQQKSISQEVAGFQKIQDTIAEFTKARVMQVESQVNGMFKMVSFKLFQQQINGGEKETCEVMVNGVPWQDLNTASKVNGGLDIINALSGHFGKSAPVWIDGRESVTELIPTNAQVINLVVNDEAKVLRIENL